MDISSQMMMDSARSMVFGGTPTIPQQGTPDKIREAAVEFEAVFATQMLEPMFEELSSDGLFGGGHAEKIFQSLMVQEFGNLIAQRGGLGIADTVATELLRIQEAQTNPTVEEMSAHEEATQ